MTGIAHKIEALLVIAVLVISLTYVGDGTGRTSVPSLLGLPKAKAEKRLADRALKAKVLRRPMGAHKLPARYRVKGQIVFQDYRDGIELPKGSRVRLMVYEPPRERRN